jgi:hypothetical protein
MQLVLPLRLFCVGTIMRFPWVFSALTVLAVSACTAVAVPEPEVSPIVACEDPRPQVCTMIFAPVCATHEDGHLETHASSCNACANDQVLQYLPGACEEQETTQ